MFPATFKKVNNTVHVETSFQSIIQFAKKQNFNVFNNAHNAAVGPALAMRPIGKHVDESFEDLFKKEFDLKGYNKHLKSLRGNNIKQNNTAQVLQRRRVRSEYDGDFDYDKRYEIAPYSSAKKIQSTAKVVNLEIEMGFDIKIKPYQINEHGYFIAALITALEERGFLVAVTGNKLNFDINHGKGLDMNTKIHVKKSDEYLSKHDLLRLLSANFYRRMLHFSIIVAADSQGKQVRNNLGSPAVYREAVNVTKGKIKINSMVAKSSQAEVLNQILEKVSA